MKDYPNLQAVLQGCVSGHSVEWPLVRAELTVLISERNALCERLEISPNHNIDGIDARDATIDLLEKYVVELKQCEAGLQAKTDALMLEYCPDEMTEEQLENWGRHQTPAKEP